MKLTFAISRLSGKSGGAELDFIELANEMVRRGHRVVILTAEATRLPPFVQVDERVICRNLKGQRVAGSLCSQVANKRDLVERIGRRFEKLRRKIRGRIGCWTKGAEWGWYAENGAFVAALHDHILRESPDILVAFTGPADLCSAMAARGTSTRVVKSLRYEPGSGAGVFDREGTGRDWSTAFENDVDHIVVLLPSFAKQFHARLQDKISVIPNFVPLAGKSVVPRDKIEKRIVAAGRLTEQKSFDLLIKAFATVAKDFPDWRVEIYGSGKLGERVYQDLISSSGLGDRVLLMGYSNDLDAIFSASAFLCHPANSEGWGRVITDAMALGVPVVAFADCSGPDQLVHHEVNGLLVDPGEDRVASLADALRRLMCDEKLRQALGREGPASVAQYAPEIVFDQWETLFRDLAAR